MVNQNDFYYIAVDENGQAYIEHGVLRNIGQRAHKYIMKIGDGAKARYLYTKEEVQAYLNGRKTDSPDHGFTGRTRNVTGKAEPIQRKEATGSGSVANYDNSSNIYQRPTIKREKEYAEAKNAIGKLQESRRKSKEAEDLKEKAGAYGNRIKDSAKALKEIGDVVGLTAKEGVADGFKDLYRSLKSGIDLQEVENADRNLLERISAYIGSKSDEDLKKVYDTIKDKAGEQEKEKLDKAKREYEDCQKEKAKLDEQVKNARQYSRDFYNQMVEKYGRNYTEQMSQKERQQLEKYGQAYDEAYKKYVSASSREAFAELDYKDAQKAYDRTVYGVKDALTNILSNRKH